MTAPTTSTGKLDDGPRIAVVIPVYNGARHLEECLDSVLAQGALVHEVIVADDGSTDATPTIVGRYVAKDPRVRSLRLTNHGRPAAPRNRGVAASTADWIAFIDADDVWLPGKLAAQIDAVRAEPHLVAVGGQARYLGSRGPMRGVFGAPPTPETWSEVRNGRALPFQVSSTLLVRRRAFDDIGGFDEEIPASEDFEFVARLACVGQIGYVCDVVAYYRLRRDSMVGDDFRRLILLPRFIAARTDARRQGADLTFEEFSANDRLTWNERRTMLGAHHFRNVAVDLSEGRYATAVIDAAGAIALTPLRTSRRLATKLTRRSSR